MNNPNQTDLNDWKSDCVDKLDCLLMKENSSFLSITSNIRAKINDLCGKIQMAKSFGEIRTAINVSQYQIENIAGPKSELREKTLRLIKKKQKDLDQKVRLEAHDILVKKTTQKTAIEKRHASKRINEEIFEIFKSKPLITELIPSLVSLIYKNKEDINHINFSTVLYNLHEFNSPQIEDNFEHIYNFLELLAQYIEKGNDLWDGQGIANALYGLKNMDYVPQCLLKALAHKTQSSQSGMKGQEIGSSLIGLAKIVRESGAETNSIKIILSHLKQKQAQLLSNVTDLTDKDITALLKGSALCGQELPKQILEHCLNEESKLNTIEHPFRTTPEGNTCQAIYRYLKDTLDSKIHIVNHNVYYMGFEMDILLEKTVGGIRINLEIDGACHDHKTLDDQMRDEYLLTQDIKVLRIKNGDLKGRDAIDKILKICEYHLSINRT